MALQHSPSIVTSNLLLYLDAANPRSYPGSGTAWYDVSGNGNHFTLYNGPTYSNGTIVFDGVDDYAASNSNLNLTAYSSITVELWFKAGNNVGNLVMEHTANWNANTGGWGLAPNSNGSVSQTNMMHTNHNSEGARNYAFTIGSNWNCQTNIFSIISDATGRLTYGNANLLAFDGTNGYSTSTATTAGGSFANAILYLCSRGGSAAFYSGTLSVVRVYGQKLTSDQVTQNFNALRGRYSI